MRPLIFFIFLFAVLSINAQDKISFAGKQFIALSVANTDSTSKWYEDVFQLTLMKEVRTPDNRIHTRIIGNGQLVVEIIQTRNSKSLEDLKLNKGQPFNVQGPFKYGFYVRNLTQAQTYLHEKKVVIKHEIFEDQDTHSKSLIFQDINGNLIQLLQDLNP
jgi:hypothetical protein